MNFIPTGKNILVNAPTMVKAEHMAVPDESEYDSEVSWVDLLLEKAKSRWFKVPEIEYLLDPETTPLPILREPPCSRPVSGTVLLFDRNVTANYKDDGHEWIKRRNSRKVREDHLKLRVNGEYRVAGMYRHSSNPISFHRRAYYLIDRRTGVTKTPVITGTKNKKCGVDGIRRPSLVLVHYLDECGLASTAGGTVERETYDRKRVLPAEKSQVMKRRKNNRMKHDGLYGEKKTFPSQSECYDWSVFADDHSRDHCNPHYQVIPISRTSASVFQESDPCRVTSAALLEKAASDRRLESTSSLLYEDNISSINSMTLERASFPHDKHTKKNEPSCDDDWVDALWKFVDSDGSFDKRSENSINFESYSNTEMDLTPNLLEDLLTLFE
eukprot:CAMPEP_0172498944 /NCGR_PEP_ID=MMETSP1066-20121228/119964_1 /TAXON_ID=671091 /ORGANISM="Coscinodiscus wailesii, Strain CCMP2513" /LENGTH=383 /DNA_ID=CAMNT_0013272439 /DNA_START=69 /DNA_END=1220 /DNA_ORIENTATION=+